MVVADIEATANAAKQLLNSKSNVEVNIIDYFKESQQSREQGQSRT